MAHECYLSRYCDVIGLRKSALITKDTKHSTVQTWDDLKKDDAIAQLAYYATVPIINMESNMFHPCQSLGDMMTMTEHFGGIDAVAGKKYVLTWAPHLKALPLATPHSQLLTPSLFGMNVTLAHPAKFPLDEDVMIQAEARAKEAGGSLTITHDQESAFADADVIVAKSWGSLDLLGSWDEEAEERKKHTDWTVTEEKMAMTNNAAFMHCLPVRRNVEVDDAVLDSGNSLIIQEAENRMWIQMAIISFLLQS